MILKFLYKTALGRAILKILTNPYLSKVAGRFLDSKASCFLIPIFIKANKIDMSEYTKDIYTNFNEFFCRRIRKAARPIDKDRNALVAPCDGLLTVYPITGKTVLPVKQAQYRISRLLRSKKLAEEFKGGTCLVFRLCVDNYHRYCYFDNGVKGKNHFIPGCLHTVRPIALENVPVFTENSREFTVMKTRHFGKVIQMEVGAMLVGKIDNYHEKYRFVRGEEKGRFLYGGSTVIVLLKKDAARIDEAILNASSNYIETPVKMGERIGYKL